MKVVGLKGGPAGDARLRDPRGWPPSRSTRSGSTWPRCTVAPPTAATSSWSREPSSGWRTCASSGCGPTARSSRWTGPPSWTRSTAWPPGGSASWRPGWCATRTRTTSRRRACGGRVVLTGLQAMLDPPRPAVAAAVAACHAAGIEVKMITGDHAATAAAIADELGLDHRPADRRRVVTGAELASLPDDEYAATVAAAGVFARVSPEREAAPGRVAAVRRPRRGDDRRRRQRRPGAAPGRHRHRDGSGRDAGRAGRRGHGAPRRRLRDDRGGGRGGARGLRQPHEVHRLDAADQHGRGPRHPRRHRARRRRCRSSPPRSCGST